METNSYLCGKTLPGKVFDKDLLTKLPNGSLHLHYQKDKWRQPQTDKRQKWPLAAALFQSQLHFPDWRMGLSRPIRDPQRLNPAREHRVATKYRILYTLNKKLLT